MCRCLPAYDLMSIRLGCLSEALALIGLFSGVGFRFDGTGLLFVLFAHDFSFVYVVVVVVAVVVVVLFLLNDCCGTEWKAMEVWLLKFSCP